MAIIDKKISFTPVNVERFISDNCVVMSIGKEPEFKMIRVVCTDQQSKCTISNEGLFGKEAFIPMKKRKKDLIIKASLIDAARG